ncbi:MAG: HAD hydrolase family protein [Rubripirellula sp.]
MTLSQRSDSEISSPIRCILSDVDGVMTDGRIVYDSGGVETKRFHVRDGLAIKLWMKSGFQFGILTARNSPMVTRRATELGIVAVKQGYEDKWPAAVEMIKSLGCTPDQVAYIGDDLPDLAVMHHVGLSVAPADAARDVREAADWNLETPGGEGVLREMIERLMRSNSRWEEHLPRSA